MGRESTESKRIQVINYQTSDMHSEVSALNEALVDKEPRESLSLIDSIRIKLSLLKDQIVNGNIV